MNTNTEELIMNKFTISQEPNDDFFKQVGERGYGFIKYKVEGFWSSDTISVRVDRIFGQ